MRASLGTRGPRYSTWRIRTIGLENVLKQLQSTKEEFQKATRRGLVRFAFLVFRDSQKIVPVDLGNLRGGGYVIWDVKSAGRARGQFIPGPGKDGGKLVAKLDACHKAAIANAVSATTGAPKHRPMVEVGYSAYYAVYVHEDANMRHRPGKSSHFLLKALQARGGDLPEIVAMALKSRKRGSRHAKSS